MRGSPALHPALSGMENNIRKIISTLFWIQTIFGVDSLIHALQLYKKIK